MPQPRRPYRSILIIKPGAVGDLLQMTPVLRALRRYSPEAKITIVVGSTSTAMLFANNPHVSETIVFDRNGEQRTLRARIEIWRMLRARQYDLVLHYQRSNLNAWFLTTAALPSRILIYHKTKNRTTHAVVNYLDTLTPLDIPIDDTSLELHPDDASREFARQFFASARLENTSVIALNPGATHAVNRWPTRHFANLADRIADQYAVKTIIVGGPGDVLLAEEIVSQSQSKPLSLTGRTSLLQLGAILERCKALVSGDTGPLHMATAVGTRTVALFGAADPARTGPVGSGHQVIRASDVSCVPCRKRTCSNTEYLACMKHISTQTVADALARILGHA